VLLIVATLPDEALGAACAGLTEDELGMDALVEVHAAGEMTGRRLRREIIGVNNRTCRRLRILETSVQLAPIAPKGSRLISESGISSAGDISRLRSVGYRAFLIGESLMRADDPGEALRAFSSPGVHAWENKNH